MNKSPRPFPSSRKRQAPWAPVAFFGLMIFLSLTLAASKPARAVVDGDGDEVEMLSIQAEDEGGAVPLELEMKLLRAEMAAVAEDWKTARPLIESLRRPLQGTPLERRWRVVLQLMQEAEGQMTPVLRMRMSWPFDLKGRYVALLPLSGPLARASEEILAALKRLPDFNPLQIIDTQSMDVEALRRTVELNSPDWILGPLQPALLRKWLATGASWPILSFAPVRENCLYCYSVTTDAQQQLALQKPYLDDGARNWLITDASFFKAERTDQLPDRALSTLIERRVDVAIRYALNIKKSEGRYGWLHKQLNRVVYFEPRARKDLDRAIIVLPEAQAYQARALMEFWRFDAPTYWLPRPLPSRQALIDAAREWPDTRAFIPPFILDDAYPEGILGIFRALGETAAAVLSASQAALIEGIETPLGRARLDKRKGLAVRYPLMENHSRRWKPLSVQE